MRNLILGISLIVIGILAVVLKDYFPEKTYPAIKYILPVILLIAGGIQVYLAVEEYREQSRKKALETTSGTLESIDILDTDKDIYPILEIGNSETFFHIRPNTNDETVVAIKQFLKLLNIAIIQEDGRMKLSAEFRDSSGNLVAEINKNEWIHKSLESDLIWDRNYTNNALEVKDSKGRIILQVIMKEDRIQFQGVIFDVNGKGRAIVEKEHPSKKDFRCIIQIGVKDNNFPVIKPIFKYPSNIYLGIYVDQ